MQARIVAVHNNAEFLLALAGALRRAGHNVSDISDPGTALTTLVSAGRLDVLIVRVGFDGSQALGLPLARVAQKKHPDVKVLFIGRPELRTVAGRVGGFISAPANVDDIVSIVQQMLILRY